METASKLNKDLQREDQNRLFFVVKNLVTKTVLSNKNRAKTWTYGYNEKYDLVVISKTGQIGDIVNINGLNIALPPAPNKIHKRSDTTSQQYWERKELPRSCLVFLLYSNGMRCPVFLKISGLII
mgnify:CR=1 FL=1